MLVVFGNDGKGKCSFNLLTTAKHLMTVTCIRIIRCFVDVDVHVVVVGNDGNRKCTVN